MTGVWPRHFQDEWDSLWQEFLPAFHQGSDISIQVPYNETYKKMKKILYCTSMPWPVWETYSTDFPNHSSLLEDNSEFGIDIEIMKNQRPIKYMIPNYIIIICSFDFSFPPKI